MLIIYNTTVIMNVIFVNKKDVENEFFNVSNKSFNEYNLMYI